MAAILGAVWGGTKTMTVTSGPGFSLMMENIGLAAMTETPCVVVDVQRGGPSTGLPTLPGQADMMQARWGSHGDYEIIALSPNSPQECFDLTIDAFNLSEHYRVPVLVMMDECVGHMTEKVVIPPADEIEIVPRAYDRSRPESTCPTSVDADLVPEMVRAGDGYRFHVTGLTHDERGYPVMTAECQEQLRPPPGRQDPAQRGRDRPARGGRARGRRRGRRLLRHHLARRAHGRSSWPAAKGVKVGLLALITVWPFPEKRIRELAGQVKALRGARDQPRADGPRGRALRRGPGCDGAASPHAGGGPSTTRGHLRRRSRRAAR